MFKTLLNLIFKKHIILDINDRFGKYVVDEIIFIQSDSENVDEIKVIFKNINSFSFRNKFN